MQRHNDDVDLDRYLLETRPLRAGDTVSVSGELHVAQGEPVLRGTDETPLLLSTKGFDGHRRWLRQRVLRKGGFITGVLVVAVSLWFEFYVPLGVLVVGWLLYGGYHFVHDADVFLEWIRDRNASIAGFYAAVLSHPVARSVCEPLTLNHSS